MKHLGAVVVTESIGPVTECGPDITIVVSRSTASVILGAIGKLHPIGDIASKVPPESAAQVSQLYLRLLELLSDRAMDQPHHGHDPAPIP